MSDDLIERLRSSANVFYEYAADNGAFLCEAADRIEYLERELAEERHSREVAAQKAWEFSDKIKELEAKLAGVV
jgi:hypothetical protein